MNDAAPIRSSAYESGLHNSRSGLVKLKEAGPSEEIGHLSIILSDNCSGLMSSKELLLIMKLEAVLE